MYKILVTDFTKNTQWSETDYIYLTEAREGCKYLATEFILKFQGSSYLNKLFYEKDRIRKGYALVKKETPVFTKITVYYKEPNGLIYSGNLKRIRSYITIKVSREENHLAAENCAELIEYDENQYDLKEKLLKEILVTKKDQIHELSAN